MTDGRFRIMLAHHRGPYKQSFVLAVLILIVLFVFFPPFEFTPYALQADDTPEVIDLEPDIEIPPPPKAVPPPPTVITPVDDPNVTTEIPENVYDRIEDLPLPPRLDDPNQRGFVPFDELPVPEYIARPVYPQLARETGIEGTVHLKVRIGLDHKVRQAIVTSSDVTPAMEKAAVEAALKCRYKPAKQQNVEVEVWVSILISFRLN